MAELADWEKTQEKVFVAWCNVHLAQKETSIQSIMDFTDGVKLIMLLEVLTHSSCPRRYNKHPPSHIHRLTNVNTLLEWVSQQNIRLVGLQAQGIVEGNRKLIMGLVWSVIRRFHIAKYGDSSSRPSAAPEASNLKNDLLDWVNAELQSYPDMSVANFKESFQDGRAFRCLVHKMVGEQPVGPTVVTEDDGKAPVSMADFNTPTLNPGSEASLAAAFRVAEEQGHIPAIVDAKDVIAGTLDEQSCMIYVAYYRNAKMLEAKRKQLQEATAATAAEPTPAPAPAPEPTPAPEPSAVSVEAQLAAALAEVERLQRENQVLRTQLADKTGATPDDWAGFKRKVEVDLLVHHNMQTAVDDTSAAQAAAAVSRDAAREQELKLRHELENIQMRIALLADDVDKKHMMISDLRRKHRPAHIKTRVEELETLIYRAEFELSELSRRQALTLASMWKLYGDALSADPRNAFALGSEISKRIEEVSDHMRTAPSVVDRLLAAESRSRGDYQAKAEELDVMFALMQGTVLLKYKQGGKGDPYRRVFFVHLFDEPTMFWSDVETSVKESVLKMWNPDAHNSKEHRQAIITGVSPGSSDEVRSQHEALLPEIEALSFTVHTTTHDIDMVAPSQEVYDLWCFGLRSLIDKVRRGYLAVGIQARLEALLEKEMKGERIDLSAEKKRWEEERMKKQQEMMGVLDGIKGKIVPMPVGGLISRVRGVSSATVPKAIIRCFVSPDVSIDFVTLDVVAYQGQRVGFFLQAAVDAMKDQAGKEVGINPDDLSLSSLDGAGEHPLRDTDIPYGEVTKLKGAGEAGAKFMIRRKK